MLIDFMSTASRESTASTDATPYAARAVYATLTGSYPAACTLTVS